MNPTLELVPARTTEPGTAGSTRWPALSARLLGADRDRVVLAVLVAALTVVSLWNVTGATAYQDDEGTYTAQAFSVVDDGELAPYTYWYDHPPLGWIQLGALVWLPRLLGLGDETYIGAARLAIAPFFVATGALVYLVARRLEIGRPLAVLATALFALSPLALTIGRQVYLDNIGIAWLLLAFYLVLSPRRALWHHIGAGVVFAVAVLSKETLSIFGPALLLALLNRPAWANRVFSVVGFLVSGAVVLAFYPLLALLRGELLSGPGHVSLQDALVYQFLTRSGSGSVWEQGSSRAELLESWLFYDQPLIVAGLVAAALCLLRRRTLWLPVALVSFAVPVVTGEGYLPAMYVVGALPFLALSVVCGLDLLWRACRRWLRRRPELLPAGRAAGLAVLAAALLVTVVPHWGGHHRTLMAQEANEDWRAALEWVRTHADREDTVLVPYSMWQDLHGSGWSDPWDVVATEKADLDPEFRTVHPEGAAAVDWIVEGPFVRSNIDSLGLTMAGEALEGAEPVAAFGGWSVHRSGGG